MSQLGPHMIRSVDDQVGPLVPKGEQMLIETAPGVTLRALAGRSLSLAVVELEPNAVAPIHRHAHEQVGFVIRGEINFEIDGARHVARAGDGYVIRPDIAHGAHAGPQGALAVEGFVAPPIEAKFQPA